MSTGPSLPGKTPQRARVSACIPGPGWIPTSKIHRPGCFHTAPQALKKPLALVSFDGSPTARVWSLHFHGRKFSSDRDMQGSMVSKFLEPKEKEGKGEEKRGKMGKNGGKRGGNEGNWERGGPWKWEHVSSHVQCATCMFGFPFHHHCTGSVQ